MVLPAQPALPLQSEVSNFSAIFNEGKTLESEASQFACCYNEMAGLRKLNSIRDRFFYPYGCLILPLGPDPEFTCKAPTGYSELIES